MTATTLLTIAGFDPSSGAGITADLAVFAAHGFFGTSCITALTVQSTLGVSRTEPVSAGLLRATLECLEQDLPAGGIKIGMLATAENVVAAADFLAQTARAGVRVPKVLDPVIMSTSGKELLTPDGVRMLTERLLPLVDWLTPNRSELGRLLGRPVANRDEVEQGARELAGRFASLSLVVTGGDEASPDDFVQEAGGGGHWLPGTRIESSATHGTGCAFSSALLCALAGGKARLEAAHAAKAYVAQAIRTATPRGKGKGPTNLLWPLRSKP